MEAGFLTRRDCTEVMEATGGETTCWESNTNLALFDILFLGTILSWDGSMLLSEIMDLGPTTQDGWIVTKIGHSHLYCGLYGPTKKVRT